MMIKPSLHEQAPVRHRAHDGAGEAEDLSDSNASLDLSDPAFPKGEQSSSPSTNTEDRHSSSFPPSSGQQQDKPELASKETTKVKNLKYFLVLLLVTVATGTSLGIFFFTRANEISEFEAAFEGQGSKLIEGFQEGERLKLETLHSLSNRLTAFALETNVTWPFVTISHSHQMLEPYRELADAAALQFMPIVDPRDREAWEEYAVSQQGWIAEDLDERGIKQDQQEQLQITPYVRDYAGMDTTSGRCVVWWQYAPVIQNRYFVNFNRLAWEGFSEQVELVERNHAAVLSSTWTFDENDDYQSTQAFNFMNELLSEGGTGTYKPGEPIGYLHYPVFETFQEGKEKNKVVAIATATVNWRSYFQDILPRTVQGIFCVVENSLGQIFTYRIDGRDAIFLGMQDLHDTAYDEFEIHAYYSEFQDSKGEHNGHHYTGAKLDSSYVSYVIKVYPSSTLEGEYVTSKPFLYAAALFCVFCFTAGIFTIYDCMVERRQKIVMETAAKSTAVVESLFPENVRNRLMEEAGGGDTTNQKSWPYHNGKSDSGDYQASRPIADFFPEVTIMFADLVGFTAWSSVREPAQVFILLENVYGAFDEVAHKRGVFKVETVGDCYVAVVGLPKPRKDHAVVMARFANDCLSRLHLVTTRLEVELGPGTSDLAMRFGLHSGAVTAGVLRGDRSRFQLFGDTMNTASRMESTGLKDHIHISEETADLLRQAGKDAWLSPRKTKVIAKGKGEVTTFFVKVGSASSSSASSHSSDSTHASDVELKAKDKVRNFNKETDRMSTEVDRLVKWNTEVFRKTLKQVVARRMATLGSAKSANIVRHTVLGNALEELAEVVELPGFNQDTSKIHVDPITIELGEAVEEQLADLIMTIACMYRKNPFHNFKHATHVTMSVVKLLSRIVAPQDVDYSGENVAGSLHDHTYGITSDPLTQFACVFAALVHDADHPGVPNSQLVKESTKEALAYGNRSVAEQNSLDLTWSLLMDDRYSDLRAAICGTQEEFNRFRQLTVNLVMATDIMDKDLKALRNNRWNKAFHQGGVHADKKNTNQNINRKATIVIEHLIQASDVAHTMQHWHVYRLWNENLFAELLKAFEEGRSEKNPAEFWYEGEIGFFDFYIIPLARKLKECGVFGVSSDEYLNYALRNRSEWVRRGKEIVGELVEKHSTIKPKEEVVMSTEGA